MANTTEILTTEVENMSLNDQSHVVPYIGRSIPPELRLEVWKHLCSDWTGKTPNVIKALRSDPTLYHEALSVLYAKNTYVFSCKNNWSFGDMALQAVKTITHVEVHAKKEMMYTGLWALGDSTRSNVKLSETTSIRSLLLHIHPGDDWQDYPPFLRLGNISYSPNFFLVQLSNLQHVELQIGMCWHRDVHGLHKQQERINDGINLMNSRLKTPAKLERVVAFYDDHHLQHLDSDEYEAKMLWGLMNSERWFWENGDGQVLGSR